MIAAWMLYCIGIAVAFVVVGEALDRALHLARRATRWAWVAALAGSHVVPVGAWLRPSAFGEMPVPLGQPAIAANGGPLDAQRLSGARPAPTRPFSLGDLDAALRWAWGLSTGAVALALLGAGLRLAAWRRRWRVTTLDGRTVLVSENVGPAVIGVWRPQVVLPAWSLELRSGERRLMLLHEEEHVRAHDPWLRAAGAALLMLTPWNPALWWQVRRLRLAVEMDCDARVLARGGDTPEYAELLLRVGQRRARLPLGAPALGEPVSFLGRRIRRMVTDLPRWRWAGATAASMVAVAVIIAACEAPRPVGLRAARDASAVVEPAQGPYSPSAAYLERLAHQYHPEVFAHPLRGAAVAFVFDARDSVIAHAAGVLEVGDAGCLEVVDRLVPTFHTSKWSSSGCAGTSSTREYACVGGPCPGVSVAKAEMFPVVVYWKSLRKLPPVEAEPGPTQRQTPAALQEWAITLAHQYHPEAFVHPLPGAAVAFVLDAQDRVIGHAAGVREPRDGDCIAVVDRLVPAFQASRLSSGGCADTAYRGAVVVYWKKLKQAQGAGDVSTESMVDERPVFLSGPPVRYPPLLRQAGIEGHVLVRAIIDTTGHAEPASVEVIDSPHPGFNEAARNALLQARFRGGRLRGRAVRVLITFPVDFRARG